MANAEYKFTNENADARGRIAEVVEFAKSRGIFIKHMEVYRDPDALKDKDTTHEIFDIPDECAPAAPEGGYELSVPLEVEAYDGLREMFAKVFGFNE